MTTEPAQAVAPATPELMRAVAVAYRERLRSDRSEHEAWLAARDMVIAHRPELNEWLAGDLAQRIIAWAAQQHGEWFWRGVG